MAAERDRHPLAVWRGLGRRVRSILAIAGVGWLVFSLLLVLPLRWIDPFTSAFILADRLGSTGNKTFAERQWVPLAASGKAIRRAVIAAEDQKFMSHWGFDLDSIEDALEARKGRGRLRGASTISQQTAKNLFLWRGRSFVRKGLEAWFTLLIEATWPKARILEVYLNLAEFGPGVYGIHAAARRNFGVAPKSLSNRQAAALASVLPSPSRMDPRRPSAYMNKRIDWIQRQMRNIVPGTGYPP